MSSRATDPCTSSLEAIVVSLESLEGLSDAFLQTTRFDRKDSGRSVIEPLERFAFESSAGRFDGVPLVEVFDVVEAKLDAVFASLWGAPFGETHDERIVPSTAPSDVPPAPLHGEHFGLESSWSSSGTSDGSCTESCGESGGIVDGLCLDNAFSGVLVGFIGGFNDGVGDGFDDGFCDAFDDGVDDGFVDGFDDGFGGGELWMVNTWCSRRFQG